MKGSIFGALILVAAVFGGIFSFASGEGIIILEGYEHGVSFCESEYHSVLFPKEAHVWNDGTATYVINKGHLNDPQVKELVALSKEMCNDL